MRKSRAQAIEALGAGNSRAGQMHFLIGAIAIVALIWFMIVSPGFRKAVIGLFVLVSLGIAWLIYNSNEEAKVRQRQQAENERFAVTAIRDEELLLTDVTLKKEGAYWYLKGSITNNSKFSLGKIVFQISIQDCPQPQNCKVIGQEAASTNSGSYSYNDRTPIVPAGQVRLFSTYPMEFKNMPATRNSQWSYKITEIRATW
jgi:hypothetical protein